MKPSTFVAAAVVAFATFCLAAFAAHPAAAQNAREVERAQGGVSCPRCNLFQADFSNLRLKGRDFAGSRLRQADMSSSVMNYTNLSWTDLRDVNGFGGVFTGVNFSHANMTNASFVGAYLEGADFAGADLTGVNFSGAQMDRARGLTQAQLSRACGDRSTQLPPGLRVRPCD